MKRLAIALAAAGLSVSAFAALPAATDPTLVAVPQFPGGFFIGGTGYYLQPAASSNDLAYGYFNNPGVTLGTAPGILTNNSSYSKVDPGYNWGWGVNAGYIFPGTGNDVNVSYFQIDTSDNHSVGIVPNLTPLAPPLLPLITGPVFVLQNPSTGLLAGTFGSVHASADYDVNQVDVTAGQFIDVGCRLILHPLVGMRWAQIDRKLDTNAFTGTPATTFLSTNSLQSVISSTLPATATNTRVTEESDFSGIGPMVGIDASYYVAYGFGFVAHADTALLAGTIDTTNHLSAVTAISSPTPTTGVIVSNSWSEPSTHRIVPVTDLKLGADYTMLLNNMSWLNSFNMTNSDLTLEAGWSFSHYYDSVDRTFASSTGFNGLGVTNINGIPSTTSGVGFQGPYVNLTLHA